MLNVITTSILLLAIATQYYPFLITTLAIITAMASIVYYYEIFKLLTGLTAVDFISLKEIDPFPPIINSAMWIYIVATIYIMSPWVVLVGYLIPWVALITINALWLAAVVYGLIEYEKNE